MGEAHGEAILINGVTRGGFFRGTSGTEGLEAFDVSALLRSEEPLELPSAVEPSRPQERDA